MPNQSVPNPVSMRQIADKPPSNVLYLLWTGGWDSTFRVVQLLRDTQARIIPVYVIDSARRSTLWEIRAMSALRRMLDSLFPQARDRLLPTRFFAKDDISADEEVTQRYQRLKGKAPLGNQYDWLSRLANEHELFPLELCIHVDDKAHAFIKEHTRKIDDPVAGEYYELGKLSPTESDLKLFLPFRFPILDWSKTEMRAYAEKANALPVMMQTWFCFSPIKGQPCGVCNPCRYSIAEGMSERFSPAALRRHRAVEIFPPLRRIWQRRY